MQMVSDELREKVETSGNLIDSVNGVDVVVLLVVDGKINCNCSHESAELGEMHILADGHDNYCLLKESFPAREIRPKTT